jgi:TFIIF-interacting CTD phosphatase-like protein
MPKADIILDLDNTLINSVTIPTQGESNTEWEEYQKAGGKKCANHLKCYNMDDYFLVYERPGLQEFLDFLFKKYNVSVWTASSQSYASFIVKHIILAPNKKRKLKLFLFDEHCTRSKENYNNAPKCLEMLYDETNMFRPQSTIIIDDYDVVSDNQEDNVIIIKPFNMDRNYKNDRELAKMKTHISRKLKSL